MYVSLCSSYRVGGSAYVTCEKTGREFFDRGRLRKFLLRQVGESSLEISIFVQKLAPPPPPYLAFGGECSTVLLGVV
jgi:hypothetical protein